MLTITWGGYMVPTDGAEEATLGITQTHIYRVFGDTNKETACVVGPIDNDMEFTSYIWLQFRGEVGAGIPRSVPPAREASVQAVTAVIALTRTDAY
jgi:hypothetical protein